MDPMTSTAEGLSGTILECSDNQSSKLQNASDSSSADTSGQKSTDNKLTGASNASDPYKCVANGVSMVWKPEIQQWIPDNEVNEDFLAYYNSTYGIQYDYSNYDFGSTNSKDTTTSEQQSSDLTGKKLTKEEKEMRRREAAERAKNWMEIDDSKSTNVYVSRLPTDITEIEFTVFFV
jgi:hypothetical protein